MATVNNPLGFHTEPIDITASAQGADGRDLSAGDLVALKLTLESGRGFYRAVDGDEAVSAGQQGSTVWAVALEDAADGSTFRARIRGPVKLNVDGTNNSVSASEEIVPSLGEDGVNHWAGIPASEMAAAGAETLFVRKVIALAQEASTTETPILCQFDGLNGFGMAVEENVT